jgi:hypothetical protein
MINRALTDQILEVLLPKIGLMKNLPDPNVLTVCEYPPYEPDTVFHGVSLAEAMLPTHNLTHMQVSELWDRFSYRLLDPSSITEAEVWEAGGDGHLREFVGDEPSKLLYALANVPGLTRDGLMVIGVDKPFGMMPDGTVVAKYAQGKIEPVLDWRFATGKRRVRDPYYCVAKKKLEGPDLVALAAVKVAAGGSLLKAAPTLRVKAVRGKQPDPGELYGIVKYSLDPMRGLFRKLVPNVFTITQFDRYIGKLHRHNTSPGDGSRTRILNKLRELDLIGEDL